jgi:membrane protease YdiL (CAAX protease family)
MIRRHPLLAYFLLTFAITWGLGAWVLLWPSQVEALFGKTSVSNPLFIVAVYAPSISALVITAVTGGPSGLRDLVSRLFRWRVGLRWYLIVLLGMPAICIISADLGAWWAGQPIGVGPGYWWLSPQPFLLSLLIDPGPLGEELGWRGFALPRLLRGRSALSASIILGLVWGVWHLPAFFVSGLPQNQFAFPVFLAGSVALSVLMAWVYQNTQGSVLFAVLIHWLFNTHSLPRGPLPILTAVLVVVAVAIVACYGPSLTSPADNPGPVRRLQDQVG